MHREARRASRTKFQQDGHRQGEDTPKSTVSMRTSRSVASPPESLASPQPRRRKSVADLQTLKESKDMSRSRNEAPTTPQSRRKSLAELQARSLQKAVSSPEITCTYTDHSRSAVELLDEILKTPLCELQGAQPRRRKSVADLEALGALRDVPSLAQARRKSVADLQALSPLREFNSSSDLSPMENSRTTVDALWGSLSKLEELDRESPRNGRGMKSPIPRSPVSMRRKSLVVDFDGKSPKAPRRKSKELGSPIASPRNRRKSVGLETVSPRRRLSDFSRPNVQTSPIFDRKRHSIHGLGQKEMVDSMPLIHAIWD